DRPGDRGDGSGALGRRAGPGRRRCGQRKVELEPEPSKYLSVGPRKTWTKCTSAIPSSRRGCADRARVAKCSVVFWSRATLAPEKDRPVKCPAAGIFQGGGPSGHARTHA